MESDKTVQTSKVIEAFEIIAPLVPTPLYWLNKDGVVCGINESCLKAIGASQDIIGKTPYEFYPKDVADHILQHNQEVIKTAQILRQEEQIEDVTTGKIKYFTSIKSPLYNDKGDIIGIVGSSLEITAEKEAERLKIEKLQEQEKFTKTVLQVVHDIRSPLVIIDMLAKEIDHFPEEDRVMLRNAVQRIHNIANNLIDTYKSREATQASAQQIPLTVFITRIFAEKQLQYVAKSIQFDLHIADSAYFAFSVFDFSELQRVLSNLINNAVEAIAEQGRITLNLKISDEKTLQLSIADTGKGMPPELLQKVGAYGLSHGKASGAGLGLAHAIETVEKYQGHFGIASVVGQGTTVTLTLPLCPTPTWFAQRLDIADKNVIVIIDDDPSIHYLWDKKLEAVKQALPNLAIHHFHNTQALDEWFACNAAIAKDVILLSDNELIGSPMNGMQLIEKYRPQIHIAFLVTSYYAFYDLTAELTRLNAHLLPKELVAHMPITIAKTAL